MIRREIYKVLDDLARRLRIQVLAGKPPAKQDTMLAINALADAYPQEYLEWATEADPAVLALGVVDAD
jgi:hypothetical protein